MIKKNIDEYVRNQAAVLLQSPIGELENLCRMLLLAREDGKSVFIAGNGGSAATASHFVNDLVKGLSLPGKKRFKAFSLCDQVAVITALANDYSYDRIFSEQLMNYAGKGDLLLVISGSGNSRNILEAVQYATSIGMVTVAMTGQSGGAVGTMCDLVLRAGTDCMEQIEDIHLMWEHAVICALKYEISREGEQ
ncbi:MAG: SIS domain-containing protein [Clostridia bacterium]